MCCLCPQCCCGNVAAGSGGVHWILEWTLHWKVAGLAVSSSHPHWFLKRYLSPWWNNWEHPARAFAGQGRGSCRPMAFSSGRNLGAEIFSSHVTWPLSFYFLMSGEFCLRSRRFAKLNFSPIKFDPLEKKEKRATNPGFQNYGLS